MEKTGATMEPLLGENTDYVAMDAHDSLVMPGSGMEQVDEDVAGTLSTLRHRKWSAKPARRYTPPQPFPLCRCVAEPSMISPAGRVGCGSSLGAA